MSASVDAGKLEGSIGQHAEFQAERKTLELRRHDLRNSWRHRGCCLLRRAGVAGGVEVVMG